MKKNIFFISILIFSVSCSVLNETIVKKEEDDLSIAEPELEVLVPLNNADTIVLNSYDELEYDEDGLVTEMIVSDTLVAPLDSELENIEIDKNEFKDVESTLKIKEYEIPIELNDLVEKHIIFFKTKGSERYEQFLQRAAIYFPMMKQILAEEGAPKELIYLTVVESGVNPHAKSRAKAIGMWQFIRGTGKVYGLKGNSWFDERKDIEKSTRAAARHMKDLYERFGDWHLALAAYNSGPNRVKKALSKVKNGNKTFWDIRKHLPKETRNYVPAFIAATLITSAPEKFNFNPIQFNEDYTFDVVEVSGNIPLVEISGWGGIELEHLKFLNPELLRDRTPPGLLTYSIKVPKHATDLVSSRFKEVKNDINPEKVIHIIGNSETLVQISKQYGVTTQAILNHNKLPSNYKPRPGEELQVPVLEPTGSTMYYSDITHYGSRASLAIEVPTNQKNLLKLNYKIQKGDSLDKIAKDFGVKVTDLKKWNGLATSRIIAGKNLIIWKKK